MIHFEFSFVDGVRKDFNLIPFHTGIQCPNTIG